MVAWILLWFASNFIVIIILIPLLFKFSDELGLHSEESLFLWVDGVLDNRN